MSQGIARALCIGMLAQVSIITGAQSNALLVPREAILGTPTPNGQVSTSWSSMRFTLENGVVSSSDVVRIPQHDFFGIVGDILSLFVATPLDRLFEWPRTVS